MVEPKRKKTYEESRAIALAKGARAGGDEKPVKPQENLSLDLWADSARGVPNVLLRNALFGIAKDRATYKNRTLMASTKDVEIRFKGESFNQTDLDVFEMLLHLARLQPLGQSFEFSASEFLKALGRKTGQSQYEQLKEEMARLIGGVVEITYIEAQNRSWALWCEKSSVMTKQNGTL